MTIVKRLRDVGCDREQARIRATPMDFRKAATEITAAIVTASGGPLMSRDDAIKFVEKYLREVYDRSRRDYHHQITDNMYPRNQE